jgi:hypothetical protein
MAYIACVALPLFLCELVACKNSVLAVDDDNVITTVNVGCKCGLVLASEECSCLRSNTSEGLACRVNYIPAALNFCRFC